jgi:hypothetical protein
MNKYANQYDKFYFRVYRFAVQFPTPQMLLLASPPALFLHYSDALAWSENNKDGLNYNVIMHDNFNLEAIK